LLERCDLLEAGWWYCSGVPMENPEPSGRRAPPSLITLSAIGATACVAADLVHEGLGHGIASWLTGDRILSISTVALQNAYASRIVSAAGTCANVAAGMLSLLMLGRFHPLTPRAYFLWVFGGFNLFNVGYLVFSAIAGGGDWGTVILGLTPVWFWRLALGLTGIIVYVMAFRWLASFAIAFIKRGEISFQDRRRLVWPAYLAGGIVLTIAATLNPISPSLILISGVGASFGLNFGFLLLPDFVASDGHSQPANISPIAFSPSWTFVAFVVCTAFIGVVGPGIRF
jgi:hypothetical protein